MYVFYVLYIVFYGSTLTLDNVFGKSFYPVTFARKQKVLSVLCSSTCNLLNPLIVGMATESHT